MATQYVFLKFGVLKVPQFEVGIVKKKGSVNSLVLFLKQNREVAVSNRSIDSFKIEETGDRFDYKVCDRCFLYVLICVP